MNKKKRDYLFKLIFNLKCDKENAKMNNIKIK